MSKNLGNIAYPKLLNMNESKFSSKKFCVYTLSAKLLQPINTIA